VTTPISQRAQLLDERLVWLRDAIAQLERDEKRSPWYLSSAVLAIPVWLIWGPWAATLAAAGAVLLACASWYIARGHRHEYENEIEVVREHLSRETGRSVEESR